ncbi:hypothetical protein [Streptomyces spongiae]|uniref:Uncharacterized protein n=1 Tax=Streptomyces spongiae TaxID=565072 RepID=A0A5N8XGH3_9ACTN|nr:hypothetical protein [Streptomyces spongiae]MPY58613.1 hypothetical protein [Streptomyces spongiae]
MARIPARPCSTGRAVPNACWQRWSSLVAALAAVTVLGVSWHYCSDTATRALLALLVVLAVPVVYAATMFGARTVTRRRVRDALVTVVNADPDDGTPSDVRLP